MKLHGVATAILPSKTKGNPFVDVTCTTIAIDESDLYNRQILPEHTFKVEGVHSRKRQSLQEAFNQVAASLHAAVELQKKQVATEAAQYRPVAFVLGGRAEAKYAVRDIRQTFLSCAVPKARSSKMQRGISSQFAEDLEGAYLRFGNFHCNKKAYSQKEKDEGVSEPLSSLNDRLKLLAPLFFNASTKTQAFPKVLAVAREYGFYLVANYLAIDPTFVSISPPVPDYHHNKKAQKKAPIYGFADWDPQIRKTIENQFKVMRSCLAKSLRISSNIYYKPASEAPSPFYVDVATPLIWDQFDVMRGRNTVKNIAHQDSTEDRLGLIGLITESGPRPGL